MDKFERYRPDEETIESWLDAFEARLLCHNINATDKKRQWCQALVGEAGRNILKKVPIRATWEQVKRELTVVLGESNPKERAFDKLLHYKPGSKGLGEIATDIMTQASEATDDQDAQQRLGVRAFLSALPEDIGKELRRKHLHSVREVLEEARFLQRVREAEEPPKEKVLAVEVPAPSTTKNSTDVVAECIKQLQEKGLLGEKRERPNGRRTVKCWCCGKDGHTLMQCPTVTKNRADFASGSAPPSQGNE